MKQKQQFDRLQILRLELKLCRWNQFRLEREIARVSAESDQDKAIDDQLERLDGGQLCPHNNPPADCDACDRLGDFHFDAAREDRIFGR